jgi:hypothetical protein
MTSEIPAALLRKHPELIAVGKALEQLGRGESITATCTVCGVTLVAVEVAETGALIICCPHGHTSFRARRGRPGAAGAGS